MTEIKDLSEFKTYEELIEAHRKENKDLIAITTKMKHSISKGDKKKKKEITTEIAQMFADMELKHEKEVQNYNINISNNSISVQNESSSPVATCTAAESPTELLRVDEVSTKVVPQKLSKAQRRRNKKAENERDRQKAIDEQAIENLKGLRHQEFLEIKKKLSARHLMIYEVPSDGNCLYKAVEHQLATLKLKETTIEELRKSTSSYLLAHKDDYINFLTDPDTENILNEEQYVKYCEDIAITSSWGGHVEIQALASLLRKPIEVVQAEGQSVFAGEENGGPSLLITYHRHAYGLGEHYNSVVPEVLEELSE